MDLKSILFEKEQLLALDKLLADLSREQMVWLHAYLEGKFSSFENTNFQETEFQKGGVNPNSLRLTVLFGTETGHSEVLAKKLAEKAGYNNINARVLSLYDYKFDELSNEDAVAIVVSTHGEGEPPDMADEFLQYVSSDEAPDLANLNFSVLALGDKTYRHFCKAGEDIYKALKRLNAHASTSLVMCDVDYDQDAEIWMNNFLLNLTQVQNQSSDDDLLMTETTAQNEGNSLGEFSKANPFMATVLEKVKITEDASEKEVYHLELSLQESGLSYQPGDSLGIYTKNPDELVQQILVKTGFNSDTKIDIKSEEFTLGNVLTNHLEITTLNFDLLRKYYEKTKNAELEKIINDDKLLDEYLYGHDVLDLLNDFPFDWNVHKFVEILRIIPPRLYSISSSMESVGEQVHITISRVRYRKNNRLRNGACSFHIVNDIEIDETLPVFIEKNPSFKLPANGLPVVMVGAGTGIAPYRAFLQHRESKGIMADTWLFFGNRNIDSDFLYDNEWQEYMEAGYLTRMDLAFSRDQENKVYVQHKLKENQKEIFEWMEKGAHFYVCGDMKDMAKDVQKTFLKIIGEQGGVSEEQAKKYLRNLKREKRYQTDVY